MMSSRVFFAFCGNNAVTKMIHVEIHVDQIKAFYSHLASELPCDAKGICVAILKDFAVIFAKHFGS